MVVRHAGGIGAALGLAVAVVSNVAEPAAVATPAEWVTVCMPASLASVLETGGVFMTANTDLLVTCICN